jgi:hypothetical protein
MPLSRILPASAVACAFCVMLIFLFPAATGPFPVVHGPATTSRAKHAADLILLCILLCGLAIAGRAAIPSGAAPLVAAASDRTSSACPSSLPVLRC